MASFIAEQPNGLLCRFSTIVDGVTHYNMTREEYIEMRMEMAKEDAIDTLDNYLQPFDKVKEMFRPQNSTQEEFEDLVKKMETPIEKL